MPRGDSRGWTPAGANSLYSAKEIYIRTRIRGDLLGVAIRLPIPTRFPMMGSTAGGNISGDGIHNRRILDVVADVLRQHDDYRPLSFRRHQNILGYHSSTGFTVGDSQPLMGAGLPLNPRHERRRFHGIPAAQSGHTESVQHSPQDRYSLVDNRLQILRLKIRNTTSSRGLN